MNIYMAVQLYNCNFSPTPYFLSSWLKVEAIFLLIIFTLVGTMVGYIGNRSRCWHALTYACSDVLTSCGVVAMAGSDSSIVSLFLEHASKYPEKLCLVSLQLSKFFVALCVRVPIRVMCTRSLSYSLLCTQVIGQDQVTYGQLQQRVAQLKEFFDHNGVGCSDNVLVTVAPSIDFYAAVLAIFAIGRYQTLFVGSFRACSLPYSGAAVVVLDTSMGLKRANHCVRLAKPVAWIHRRGEYWYFKVNTVL